MPLPIHVKLGNIATTKAQPSKLRRKDGDCPDFKLFAGRTKIILGLDAVDFFVTYSNFDTISNVVIFDDESLDVAKDYGLKKISASRSDFSGDPADALVVYVWPKVERATICGIWRQNCAVRSRANWKGR